MARPRLKPETPATLARELERELARCVREWGSSVSPYLRGRLDGMRKKTTRLVDLLDREELVARGAGRNVDGTLNR